MEGVDHVRERTAHNNDAFWLGWPPIAVLRCGIDVVVPWKGN